MKRLDYRADIDGLRAIAVICVIFYHFNKDFLPGGFVGVDIFFVISGCLITGIIQKDLNCDSFSFFDFYLRRVKRIMPATVFVCLVTLIVGAFFIMPKDMEELSLSAVAAVFSFANVYYWLFLDTSYFASSSDTVPLLHMWSLGVEEQFYLIWPALLVLTFKALGKRSTIVVAVCILVVSFGVSEYSLNQDKLFAYYMLPSRAGELMLGGIIYYLLSSRFFPAARWISELASWVGASLLIISFYLLDSESDFPGVASLLPALGAALIIIGGHDKESYFRKFLSYKIFVFIGVISFSLYLWHWPVLAYYRYGYGNLGFWEGFGCAILIVVLSVFSYFFVEKKFRYRTSAASIDWKFPVMAGGLCIFTISSYITLNKGVVEGLTPKDYKVMLSMSEEVTKSAPQYPYVCQLPTFKPELLKDPKCIIGDKEKKPSVLVFGDSNASHYLGYLKIFAEREGIAIRNIEHSSCPPLLNYAYKYVKRNKETCVAFNESMRSEAKKYDTVIVGASWTSYKGEDYHQDLKSTLIYHSKNVDRVIVLLKVPVVPGYDKACEAKSIRIPFLDCMKKSTVVEKAEYPVNLFIKSLSEDIDNLSVVSLREYLCRNGRCSAYIDNIPVYFDEGHLSMFGSEYIGSVAVKEERVKFFR